METATGDHKIALTKPIYSWAKHLMSSQSRSGAALLFLSREGKGARDVKIPVNSKVTSTLPDLVELKSILQARRL
jgi:hypothetical protein